LEPASLGKMGVAFGLLMAGVSSTRLEMISARQY
jgi:hypothetical protein